MFIFRNMTLFLIETVLIETFQHWHLSQYYAYPLTLVEGTEHLM